MVRYCHNCGAKIENGEYFCSQCGSKRVDLDQNQLNSSIDSNLSEKSNNNDSENNSDDNSELNSNNNFSNSSSKYKKGSSFKYFILIIIVFLVLIAISTQFLGNLNSSDDVYNITISENLYLSGEGIVNLIDSNDSYIKLDELNSTGSSKKEYFVSLNNYDQYQIRICTLYFDTPIEKNFFNLIEDNGSNSTLAGIAKKGEYNVYVVQIYSTNNDSKYLTKEFLNSIIYKDF